MRMEIGHGTGDGGEVHSSACDGEEAGRGEEVTRGSCKRVL